ncbi:hypothetical protein O206_05860 [Ochrobactrum sp. EGD-AQ16]|nr:hypothetical protein O206_05860 [Ochrobactrum sp. EGD-AQ16]
MFGFMLLKAQVLCDRAFQFIPSTFPDVPFYRRLRLI